MLFLNPAEQSTCFSALLNIQFKFYRAVVAAKNIIVNVGTKELLFQPVGDDEVVDTPADILLSCLESV